MRPPLRPFFPKMKERLYQAELMDEAGCNEKKLNRTIRQFGLLNALFSAAVPLFRKHILPVMKTQRDREWTILDLGAGGGDIDRALVRLVRRQGLKVRITALDLDEKIVGWARDLCQNYPEITVVQGSAFDLTSLGMFDFVISNHMLHHLSFDQVSLVTANARAHSRFGYLLNDLRRSLWAYLGYTLFTALFVHRSFAFTDGRLSIRRGFLRHELEKLFPRTVGGQKNRAQPEVLHAEPARIYLLELAALSDGTLG